MIVFLLKSSACLAVFLIFYKLVLEKERMHTFKRFYLLAALLLALVIPSITFTEYVEGPSELTDISGLQTSAPEIHIEKTALPPSGNHPVLMEQKSWTEYWIDHKTGILWTVYGLGLVLFAWKFLFHLNRIFRTVHDHPKIRKDDRLGKGLLYVLLQDAVVPHTFFHYIFLDRKKFEKNEIPKDVLLHEAAHARQKHSIDIMLVEILTIVFWFNPIIHWTKKAIKLNHEFLADEAVLEQGIPTSDYQNILLSFASSSEYKRYRPSMANAVDYSSIKKRFKVMKTRTSRKSILVRTLLIAPLLALVLYGFSTKVQKIKEPITTPTSTEKSLKTESTGSADQEGATKKQLIEYNRLAKKYTAMLAEDGNIWFEKPEVELLEYLYGIMTEKQRGNAEPYPDFPEPPEAPTPPNSPNDDEAYAQTVIEYIIENQDPHDRPGYMSLKSGKRIRQSINVDRPTRPSMTAPPPSSELNIEQRRDQLEKQSEEMDRQTALIQKQVEKIEQQTMQLQEQSLAMEEQREEIEKAAARISSDKAPPMPPSPPSPPKPKSLTELLEELKDKDVKIIIDGNEVEYKEAKKRFETDSFSKINVKQVTGKRPIIKVTTKK